MGFWGKKGIGGVGKIRGSQGRMEISISESHKSNTGEDWQRIQRALRFTASQQSAKKHVSTRVNKYMAVCM